MIANAVCRDLQEVVPGIVGLAGQFVCDRLPEMTARLEEGDSGAGMKARFHLVGYREGVESLLTCLTADRCNPSRLSAISVETWPYALPAVRASAMTDS